MLVSHKVSALPVVDDEEKIVGVVSVRDIRALVYNKVRFFLLFHINCLS